MMRYLAIALCAICSLANAQLERWAVEGRHDIESDLRTGVLLPISDNAIDITWWDAQAVKYDSHVVLGMSKLLAGEIVSSQVDADGAPQWPFEKFLFAGDSATAGSARLVLVGWDSGAGTYQVLASQDYPGKSFAGVGVAIAQKKIYVLDRSASEILTGAFDPSLAALPGALSVLVTQSQCPGLSAAASSTLFVASQDTVNPGIILGRWPDPMRETFWTIKDSTPSPIVTLRNGDKDFARIAQPRGQLVVQQSQVEVSGKGGMPFSVVSVITGQSVGTGVLPPSGHVSVTTTPLVMGDIYGVAGGDGVVRAPYLTPVKYYGITDTTSNGFAFRSLLPTRGMVAEIGNGLNVAPAAYLNLPPGPPVNEQQWSAWLLVGSEADIAPSGGGQSVLVTNVTVPSSIHWKSPMIHASGAEKMVSPTDTMLAGATVCFQWMLLDGQNLRFSDIMCVMLRGSVFDPKAISDGEFSLGASRRSSSVTSPRPMDRESYARFVRWASSQGAKPLPGRVAALLALKRMERR